MQTADLKISAHVPFFAMADGQYLSCQEADTLCLAVFVLTSFELSSLVVSIYSSIETI